MALHNVDNNLELACQWLLATAARDDDDGEQPGAEVGLQSNVLCWKGAFLSRECADPRGFPTASHSHAVGI